MKAIKKTIYTLTLALAFVSIANAQKMDNTVEVGGEAMYPKKNIVENAVNSKAHTTLVAAVKAAGLVETLQSEGPFTVFAPTNDAFENLPDGTVASLLEKKNKEALTGVLTYHVVAGNLSSAKLMELVKKGRGQAELKTVNGGILKIKMNGPSNLRVIDANGNGANISVYDVTQSNGVIHVIDAVLLPKM